MFVKNVDLKILKIPQGVFLIAQLHFKNHYF